MIRHAGAVLVISLGLLLVAPASAPVELSYVSSDSMEPTIRTNDGYVRVSAGAVQSGDIVTFWSERRQSYVTHRVSGQTETGYVTRGDNNPTTDQAAGYPLVERSDIVGKVFTVSGQPLVIPQLGHLIGILRTARPALLGGLLVVLGRSLWNADRARTTRRARPVTSVGDIVHTLLVTVLLVSVAMVVLAGSTHDISYLAVNGESNTPTTLPVDEPSIRVETFALSRSPFIHHVVRADGMSISEQTMNSSSVALTLRVPPPETPGVTEKTIHFTPYPAVFPPGVIEWLHDIHPGIAALGTVAVGLSPVYLLYLAFFDGGEPIRPSRVRWLRRLGGE